MIGGYPDPSGHPESRLGRGQLIEQIRERGIENLEILELFHRIPRDLFLPSAISARAWEDSPIPIGWGQTASQPSLQALYLQALDLRPDDRVLEIGTGSGFLTALLSQITDRVYSIERIRDLSQRARQVLDDLGIRNVAIQVGDGTIGWRKFAPFDVIVVSAGSPAVPPALLDQLAVGGRLLIPVGDRLRQELLLLTKGSDGEIESRAVLPECSFVPLLGRFAWDDDSESPATERADR